MKFRKNIGRILPATLLLTAFLFSAVSLIITPAFFDAEHSANNVSRRLQRRVDILDSYAGKILESAQSGIDWSELKSLPEDMVIYKYVDDTLHSWYNLFSIKNDDINIASVYPRITGTGATLFSPLSKVGSDAAFLNMGQKWYIVKSRTNGNVRIYEGLLIKDNRLENRAKGNNGVNSHLKLRSKFTVTDLSDADGSAVMLGDLPVFKVKTSDSLSSVPDFIGFQLRLDAIIIAILAIILFLAFNRKTTNCLWALLAIIILGAAADIQGQYLIEHYQLFSPTLYAHDGLLNSFGTLTIFGCTICTCIFCIYLCRECIAASLMKRGNLWKYGILAYSFLTVALAIYVFYTLVSLIKNSVITLELYRLNLLSVYTLVVYLLYSFLLVSVLLCVESLLTTIGAATKRRISVMTTRGILTFSIICSIIIGTVTSLIAFEKEANRVMGWSNRLAVDRDLMAEMELRRIEDDISSDAVLQLLCFTDKGEQLILKRLDERYLNKLNLNYDLTVSVRNSPDSHFPDSIMEMVKDGTPIAPQSHFTYHFGTAARYAGIFSFSNQGEFHILYIELSPKGNPENLPPLYSYAKYVGNKLVTFSGNYAYPTLNTYRDNKTTFIRDGFRHFVNIINENETIVISRRERGFITYFVSFTYLVLLLFLCALPFRREKEEQLSEKGYFSTRMRRLIEASLIVTLITMASVCVIFVYQRNERTTWKRMAEKISTIQIMLDDACRSMDSKDAMLSGDFAGILKQIGRNTNSSISIYSPDGRLFMSNSPEVFDDFQTDSRLAPDAFRSIVLSHNRYYIHKSSDSGWRRYILYAPVLGASGKVIAIAASPYMEMDYEFMSEAVFHSAAIISLFLILLFITLWFTQSMTNAVFRPLLIMREKMVRGDAQSMEMIEYEGNDEISALVESYNKMVVDLKESTGRLAVAERDKAWSEMARQVAHEIKNPLTPIKLEIQRLARLRQKNDPNWEDKFDSVSKVILEHIDILANTANDFSTFAKLYSEPSVEINLDSVLKDQIMLFGSKEGIEITYLGTENAVISGPKPQLIRVFVNLLTNAMQAVEKVENPQIMISLRKGKENDTWDIVFEDNGPGVDEENRDKLFVPNFTTKSSGTGLGLAMCRSIVDKCGGNIIYSKSFNLSGACFTITLKSNK